MPYLMKPNGRIESVSKGDLEKFVAKGYGVAYVPRKFTKAEATVTVEKEQVKIDVPKEEPMTLKEADLIDARDLYTDLTGKAVPNNKKNDIEWLKEKATLGVV